MSILTLLEMIADLHPDRVAVSDSGDHLTYTELLERARGAGALIAENEVDHLALLDLNGVSFPVALFGAAAAGVPFAPLNYRLADDRLQHAVERLNPVLLVAGSGVGPDAATAAAAVGIETRRLVDTPSTSTETAVVDPQSAAVLLFTSGTTGDPKIAVLRHRHLFSYVVSTVEFAHAGEDEAIMVSVPNYHIAGISSMLTSIFGGRRIVQLRAFTPEAWVDTAVAESVTHAMVVPTMLGRILDVVAERGITLPALRHLSYGGGRMPRDVVERAMDLLPHVDLVNAYGLTETSSTVSILSPDEHRDARVSADPAIRARLGSVGRPVPSIELEVRDAAGRQVPSGVSGEIYVRGEQVAGEYTSHSAVDAEGWYATRDRGTLDAAGYLYLEGRADDVIVRGGENISPQEIEDNLLEHPAVRAAAVVGVPDDEWGERVEAVVVLEPGTDSDVSEPLREWVRASLRSTRVPERIHIRDELPFNETGKLLRRVIRQDLTDLLEVTP